MVRFVVIRLLQAIPLVLLATAITFILIALTPGDAARAILGTGGTEEQYLILRERMGLDRPLWEQYWTWLTGAVGGDLGVGLFSSEPVISMLNTRLGVTASVVLITLVVAAVFGIALGVLSATRSGWVRDSADVAQNLGAAIPNFWLGYILIAVAAVQLGILPATGYVSPEESVGDWATSLILPVLTLATGGATAIAKQTRDAMMDTLDRPYIRTLRAAGFTRRSIVLKHALRNAAIPVVTMMGVVVAGLLGGTVVVEQIFAMPGLGLAAVSATNQHDVPVIQGVVVYFTLIVVFVNILVDLAYGTLNPKMRHRD